MDLRQMIEEILPPTFEALPNMFFRIIVAIFIIVIGRLIAKALSNLLRKALESAKVDKILVPFFSRISYYIMLAIDIVIAPGVVAGQPHRLWRFWARRL